MHIRSLNISDSKEFLNLLDQLDNETEFMLYEPGERKTTSTEMKEYLKSFNTSIGIVLGAFENNNLVGYVSLKRGRANRIKHIGYIVIGVLKKFGGKGIGTELLKSIDRWAENQEIKKLELTVMSHNHKAQHLYLKSGYKKEGIKKMSVLVNGKFYDEYYMGKII